MSKATPRYEWASEAGSVGQVLEDGRVVVIGENPAPTTRAQAIAAPTTRTQAIEITKALLWAHGIGIEEEWGFDTGFDFVRYESKEDAEDQAKGRPHLQRRLARRLVSDPIPEEHS